MIWLLNSRTNEIGDFFSFSFTLFGHSFPVFSGALSLFLSFYVARILIPVLGELLLIGALYPLVIHFSHLYVRPDSF